MTQGRHNRALRYSEAQVLRGLEDLTGDLAFPSRLTSLPPETMKTRSRSWTLEDRIIQRVDVELALDALRSVDPGAANYIDLRFRVGLEEKEIAEEYDLSGDRGFIEGTHRRAVGFMLRFLNDGSSAASRLAAGVG